MNIYEKLQTCRVKLQESGLKKTGKNPFSKYDYFELSDFLPQIMCLFNDLKLCSIVKFDDKLAALTIINTEKPDETIVFTSPMASANLKGCHEVQNLGAVETYQRRYLYMTAMEIVENDMLDKSHNKNDSINNTKQSNKATKAQIAEVFKLAKEKENVIENFKVFSLLNKLLEDKQISSKYPYADKEKKNINWTVEDIECIKTNLELPF